MTGEHVGGFSVGGTTRVVAVIGDPVEHSLSPPMHNAAFQALGLDFVYVALRPRNAGRFLRSLAASGLRGVNVTVPFKNIALRSVDRKSEAAEAIGAVNAIVVTTDGVTVGDNTDAGGFAAALRARKARVRGKKALVIGAGGAAQAVVYQLLRDGASRLLIANRTKAKASRLASRLTHGRCRAEAAGLAVLSDRNALGDFDIVVNATSVGLSESGFLNYAADATPETCVHVDLAYRRGPTPFVALAARCGRPTIDGRAMLLHQGALSFRQFTGKKAPLDVMARAIGFAEPDG